MSSAPVNQVPSVIGTGMGTLVAPHQTGGSEIVGQHVGAADRTLFYTASFSPACKLGVSYNFQQQQTITAELFVKYAWKLSLKVGKTPVSASDKPD